jgi:hypothetical protein
MQAPLQVTGIHYPKVHLGSNVEDRYIFNADHNSINTTDLVFQVDLGYQGSTKCHSITDLSNAMLVLKFEATIEKSAQNQGADTNKPCRFSHHAFSRSLVKSTLKVNGVTVYNNNQAQGLISTSIIKHDLPEEFMSRYDGYVMNKDSVDPTTVGGQTHWEELLNTKANALVAAAGAATEVIAIGIPLVVLDTFYAKAKAPMGRIELRISISSFSDMVSKRYIYSDDGAGTLQAYDRNTNNLRNLRLSQGNLLIPMTELAPLSIVQLEENGEKPFAIAMNYQKIKVNNMSLTSTTNNKALNVTNGRSVEIYVPEVDSSLKTFSTLSYERLSFSGGGQTYPKITVNNYPELNRISHGIKAFCMKPIIQGNENYLSLDALDTSVNKFKRVSPFYPHSFDLSLADINDVLYENSDGKNTFNGNLQLNFTTAPNLQATNPVTGSEYDYANAFVLQREDVICEFRKVDNVFTPVIVTNDV